MLVCNLTVAEVVNVSPLGVMVGALTVAVGAWLTDKVKLVVAWHSLFFPVTVIV